MRGSISEERCYRDKVYKALENNLEADYLLFCTRNNLYVLMKCTIFDAGGGETINVSTLFEQSR